MAVRERAVRIPASGRIHLDGDLALPEDASGVVAFAHGSGSSRHSPRNRMVAARLQAVGLGTLLLDLLTQKEEEIDRRTGELRFDVDLLAERFTTAVGWLGTDGTTRNLRVGAFGASTGAAAALSAAANLPDDIHSIVSRGGRPDLAGGALPLVRAPTLLLVGGLDTVVIELNREALDRLTCEKELTIVPGATHLFEEPGALEEVAQRSADWFRRHLAR